MTRFFSIISLLLVGYCSYSQIIPDPDFGISGLAVTNFNTYSEAYRMALQPDGKIVTFGFKSSSYSALARFNADGTIDTSFGTNGKVIAPYGSDLYYLQALGIQQDGKIVAATTRKPQANVVDFEYVLMRFNADGSVDTSFGTNGATINHFSVGLNANGPRDIAIQEDQKIIVLGSLITASTGRDFGVIRYNTDGTLDSGFGTNGLKAIDFSSNLNAGADNGSQIAIQPDGKLVVAGFVGLVPSYDIGLARLNTNGSLDTSFGTNGKVIYDLGGNNREVSLQLAADGKLIVGSNIMDTDVENSQCVVARFNPNGSIDNTFGTDGKTTFALSGDPYEQIWDIALQPDGKIIAAGTTGPLETNPDNLVLRFNTNGTIDDTFNGNGYVITDWSTDDRVYAVAVQENGRILLAGASKLGATSGLAFAVTRYVDAQLSITSTTEAEPISIYPNPATTILNISGDFELKSAVIYNVLGQRVKTAHSKSIDIADLPAGCYLVQIDNGKKDVETVKFLKN